MSSTQIGLAIARKFLLL